MTGLIPNPSRIRKNLTGLTKRSFNLFEEEFGAISDRPFPTVYLSDARYLAARLAVPHWFVNTQVGSAEGDRKRNRTPEETVDEGGNCVDRCILLGSIWATMSVPSELLSITGEGHDAAHLTAVATLPACEERPSPESLTDALVRLYADIPSHSLGPDDINVWTEDGDLRVVADPIFCDHVGDVGSMVDHEFATFDGRKPEWAYHNVIRDVIVPVDTPAYRRYE